MQVLHKDFGVGDLLSEKDNTSDVLFDGIIRTVESNELEVLGENAFKKWAADNRAARKESNRIVKANLKTIRTAVKKKNKTTAAAMKEDVVIKNKIPSYASIADAKKNHPDVEFKLRWKKDGTSGNWHPKVKKTNEEVVVEAQASKGHLADLEKVTQGSMKQSDFIRKWRKPNGGNPNKANKLAKEEVEPVLEARPDFHYQEQPGKTKKAFNLSKYLEKNDRKIAKDKTKVKSEEVESVVQELGTESKGKASKMKFKKQTGNSIKSAKNKEEYVESESPVTERLSLFNKPINRSVALESSIMGVLKKTVTESASEKNNEPKTKAAREVAQAKLQDYRKHKRLGIVHPGLGRKVKGADIAGAESEVNQHTYVDVKSLNPRG